MAASVGTLTVDGNAGLTVAEEITLPSFVRNRSDIGVFGEITPRPETFIALT